MWFGIEVGKNLKLLQMEYKVRVSNENGRKLLLYKIT